MLKKSKPCAFIVKIMTMLDIITSVDALTITINNIANKKLPERRIDVSAFKSVRIFNRKAIFRKYYIFSFIIILTLMVVLKVSAAEYSMGMVFDDIDDVNRIMYEDKTKCNRNILPTQISLKNEFPSPGHQGTQNSCSAWTTAYALKSHQEQVYRQWGLDVDEHLFSPSYVYNQRQANASDGGMTIMEAMSIIANQGVCSLASFPFDEYDNMTQPTEIQRLEAAQYKAIDYYAIKSVNSFKRHLSNGDGIVIGIEVYDDFININPSNPIYDDTNGKYLGSHAITLIGYSDEKQAFEFINSWGTDWGIGGYGWISYDLLNDEKVNSYGIPVGFVLSSHYDIENENGFEYFITKNDEATIYKYNGSTEEVSIPDTLGGCPVTEIHKGAFENNSHIKKILIPKTVVSIGQDAFRNCTELADINIPEKMSIINERTFSNIGIKNIEIPINIEYIAKGAFLGCKALMSVNIANREVDIDILAFGDLCDDAIIYVPDSNAKETVVNSIFPKERIIAELEYGSCGDDLHWEFRRSSKTLTIDGKGEMWKYTKTDEVPWRYMDDAIDKTVICNEVTSIDKTVFNVATDMGDVVFDFGSILKVDNGYYSISSNRNEIFFSLAVHDDKTGELKNIYLSGCSRISRDELLNGKIFIWDNMRPCYNGLIFK